MELIEHAVDDPTGMGHAYALQELVRAQETPWELPVSPDRFRLNVRAGWDSLPGRVFVARDGREVVGGAEVYASAWDNRDMALVELRIHPRYRRRGYGTVLLRGLIEAAGQDNRTLITVDAWDSPGARAYAHAVGLSLTYIEAIRRLHPHRFGRSRWDMLYAEAVAHAEAYELISCAGESPPELLTALGEVSEAINDAPLDDMELAQEHYPAERLRDYEQSVLGADQRLYRVIARHRASGELAAHTVIVINADDPTFADQHETAVLPAHRGHRLGLLVKAAMLQWLDEAEPALQTIDTGNARSNRHMVAINDRLGFEFVANRSTFQRRFPAAAVDRPANLAASQSASNSGSLR